MTFIKHVSKLILKYEPDIDFVLIAITCPLKEYLLAFKVNNLLNVDFVRIADLSLESPLSGESVYFARYNYHIEDSGADFFLIANKGTEGYLIPEMKKSDYFVLIRDCRDAEYIEEFIEGLNKIQDIVMAIDVKPEKLKSKENLIF